MKRGGVVCLGFLILLLSIFIAILPIRYLIPESFIIAENDKPHMFLDHVKKFHGQNPTSYCGKPVSVSQGPSGFVLIVTKNGSVDDSCDTPKTLSAWYHENMDWFKLNLVEFGGVLLRGFTILNHVDFDFLVGDFHRESDGTGVYVGTAPRQKINGTRFVSSASEIPRPITIPTHLELCYTPNPPKRLYFYVELPNKAPGGQTPLTDFKAVWNDLPIALRDTLYRRGMVYERRYFNENQTRPFDPLITKSWQEMFKTQSKETAESIARSQEFLPIWEKDDHLLLKHYAVVNRTHTETQLPYWSTHFNVLHAATYAVPYAWSAQLFQSRQSALISLFMHTLLTIRRWLGLPYGHNMAYADTEEEISWEDAMTIRRAISRQTWMFDWQLRDMLIIDNHRLAHGRSPWFYGDRKVYVAWN